MSSIPGDSPGSATFRGNIRDEPSNIRKKEETRFTKTSETEKSSDPAYHQIEGGSGLSSDGSHLVSTTGEINETNLRLSGSLVSKKNSTTLLGKQAREGKESLGYSGASVQENIDLLSGKDSTTKTSRPAKHEKIKSYSEAKISPSRQDFMQSLKEKGFFDGANEGTNKYKAKLDQAEKMFELKYGWKLKASTNQSTKDKPSHVQGEKDLAARAARMYESFNIAQKKSRARLANRVGTRVSSRVNRSKSPRAQSLPLHLQSKSLSKSYSTWASSSDSESSNSLSSSSDSDSGSDRDNEKSRDNQDYIDAEDTDSDENDGGKLSLSSSIDEEHHSTPGLHQVHPSAERIPTTNLDESSLLKHRASGLQVWHGRNSISETGNDDNKVMDVRSCLKGRSPDFSWKIGDQIGSGAHGIVFRGLNQRTGALIAVKQIPIDGIVDSSIAVVLQREVDILTDMNHPHVVRYYGLEVQENLLHLITEYVSGGSIADQLNQFGAMQEGLVCRHTRQILVGLAFLHAHGVIHRDIKGQNILVSKQGILKLADFGAAQTFDGIKAGKRHALCGTPAFVAPEIILEAGHDDRADIWSLGCTIIQMLTAETPWSSKKFGSLYELLHHIAYENESPPLVVAASAHLLEFLSLCFERNKAARPSAGELLRHRLLENADFDLAGNLLQRAYSVNDRVKVSPSPSIDETPQPARPQTRTASVEAKQRKAIPSSNSSLSRQDDTAVQENSVIGIHESHFEEESMPGMRNSCFGCLYPLGGTSRLEAIVMPSGGSRAADRKTRNSSKKDERENVYARGLIAQRRRGQTRRRRCVVS